MQVTTAIISVVLMGSCSHCLDFEGSPPPRPSHDVRFYSGLLNKIIPNYGMISGTVFREGDYGLTIAYENDVGENDGLNDGLWCQSAKNADNIGKWKIPNGTVLNVQTRINTPEQVVYDVYALGQIGLLRPHHLTIVPSYNLQGMYECEIPDENNIVQNLALWIGDTGAYLNITNFTISDNMAFHLSTSQPRDEDPPTFSLTFTVNTAPPTYVTCQVGDDEIDDIEVSREHLSSIYINGGVPISFRVTVTLKTRTAGDYKCIVSVYRDIGGAEVEIPPGDTDQLTDEETSVLSISVTDTPTQLVAYRTLYSTVELSWTAPASNSPPVAGYEVFYEVLGSGMTTSGANTTTTNATLSTGLMLGQTYEIFVVAYSDTKNTLPSEHSHSVLMELDIPQLSPTLNTSSTTDSLTVSWSSPQYLPTGYELTCVCTLHCHNLTVAHAVQFPSPTETSNTILGLPPSSVCNVALTALYDEVTSNTVLITMATTSTDISSSAPSDLSVISAQHTSLIISWSELPCPERNGRITGYMLQYSNSSDTYIVQFSSADNEHFLLEGLSPCTEYTLSIAAINDAGTSNFSLPVDTITDCSGLETTTKFQLKFGRVQDCSLWTLEKALILEDDLKAAIETNIMELCECTFSQTSIQNGSFSCHDSTSTSAVTYRANISGRITLSPHTPTTYLKQLKVWAESGAASFVSEMRRMWIDKNCCVVIDSFSDSECISKGIVPRCTDIN